MKKVNGSNELKISIDGKVMLVSQARADLDNLLAKGDELAQEIEAAKAIENPSPKQQQALEELRRQQRLNDERVSCYSAPLNHSFPQYATTSH